MLKVNYHHSLPRPCKCGCGELIPPGQNQWHSVREFVDRTHYNRWQRDRAEANRAPIKPLVCRCGKPGRIDRRRPTPYCSDACRNAEYKERKRLRQQASREPTKPRGRGCNNHTVRSDAPTPEQIYTKAARLFALREPKPESEKKRRHRRLAGLLATDSIAPLTPFEWPEELR